MNKKLRFSRWRRLPSGLHRITEKKLARPEDEMQRLTLYLPGRLLDRADELARKAGVASVQSYCEAVLGEAIEARAAHVTISDLEERRGPLEGLDAIANDPDYLVEWTASASGVTNQPKALAMSSPDGSNSTEAEAISTDPRSLVVQTVLRHAGQLEDQTEGLLPALRRGERIEPASARELLQALIDLERLLEGADTIERPLAFALHRLAFESQILITDAWPGLASDPPTLDALRLIQEAVDRVLSGEDIRYGGS